MNFIDQYKELYPDPVVETPAEPELDLEAKKEPEKKHEAKVVPVPLRALKPTK